MEVLALRELVDRRVEADIDTAVLDILAAEVLQRRLARHWLVDAEQELVHAQDPGVAVAVAE